MASVFFQAHRLRYYSPRFAHFSGRLALRAVGECASLRVPCGRVTSDYSEAFDDVRTVRSAGFVASVLIVSPANQIF